jgi:hypothetical protein
VAQFPKEFICLIDDEWRITKVQHARVAPRKYNTTGARIMEINSGLPRGCLTIREIRARRDVELYPQLSSQRPCLYSGYDSYSIQFLHQAHRRIPGISPVRCPKSQVPWDNKVINSAASVVRVQ